MTYRDLRQMYNAQCELTDELVSERDMARQHIAELESELAALRHERNVLQKICAERSDELAAAQATISRMRDLLTKIEYLESDNGCIMSLNECSGTATEALALPSDRTALDAMLADARKERAEQIIALAEHKAKRAQEYSDRAEENDGEPDYHAEGIADGLLNLVREIRQAAERGAA